MGGPGLGRAGLRRPAPTGDARGVRGHRPLRLLLDTHILIWTATTPARVRPATLAAMAAPGNTVLVSMASVWEIAIKRGLGRINFDLERLDELLDATGISLLPIEVPHAIAAGALPRLHGDPFDRLLIAQALVEGLVLVSDDRRVAAYDVPLFDRQHRA